MINGSINLKIKRIRKTRSTARKIVSGIIRIRKRKIKGKQRV